MGTHLILSLWTLSLLSLSVIAGTDIGDREAGGAPPRVRPAVAVLAVDALLLIGVGLGSLYGVQLAEESPRFYQALQGALPLLLGVFGGVFAARWFVAGARHGSPAWHSAAGGLALVLALALVLVTGGAAGILMDSAAVLVLLLSGWLALTRSARARQALRLGAALCLLWAGAFLVYLMIFPAQVTVEAVAEEGAATAAAAPGESLLWVAPLVFLAAFLLGFFKRQRG